MLLHISDPHFGTERPNVVAALERLSAELQPQLVVLSGDITQRARSAQFGAARAMLDRLARPSLVVPGNHDIPLFDLWSRWRSPYAHHRRAFGHQLEPEWQSADWLVIGLNTTRPGRHKDGELSEAQISRVCTRLRAAAAGQRRVVVTHQPMLVTRPEDRSNLLHGHAEAAARWAEAGADLLLGGHIHLPYVRPLREAHPTIARDVWVVQAGTAVSQRIRGDIGNSVNVLRSLQGHAACLVERWDFRDEADAFVLIDRRELVLDRPV